VTDFGPFCGAPRSAATSAVRGERPLAFSPVSRPPSYVIAKASPPMPVDIGSTTHSIAAAATHASAAVPPSARARRPASVACG
jgi:hypothetical protein